ncbi:hypothetical protein [Marinoscillum pacificum]|uniref:hypothetical protein n=1 Tax=Marinoscillum pacificum TaxID=392723 RepID=UPI0021582E5F|nr:hypothetical protein [Marinoscillum pacificum]
MKTFCIICICFVAFSFHASAQKIVVDSSFANAYKKTSTTTLSQPAVEKEDSESFGDLVGKIGEGIWQRLKYRLNLEEVKEGLEAKKEKFSGKPEDEDQSGNNGG